MIKLSRLSMLHFFDSKIRYNNQYKVFNTKLVTNTQTKLFKTGKAP